ncbi:MULTISPECIES: hypothetical protein [unclassified Pseudomonas]|uniref:hypothetical protein n=1 Tax=unclassified Pseudomonas TaxID=196821 RepID=UPI0025EB06A1|nr:MULTISPECIES: hypothetical protein [unclassified Pseudomonas]
MQRYTSTLFPPVNREPSTLALRPVLIAGLVTPVEDGDGGVNFNIVNDPYGMLAAVDPWSRMAVGDHVDIYWDTERVAQGDVGPDDVNERMFFLLDTQPITAGWAENVHYRLTRQGSSTPEDSVGLRIRVKLDFPGGLDREPHLPGHSELAAPGLPQEVIDNGVDASWAARGIPAEIAAYPGRAAYDTIRLVWGDVPLNHRVTPAEAAGRDPIVITVDQATVLAAGDARNLLVRYQVYDEVWNFSSDWSRSTYVDVEAGAQRLNAPVIKDAFNGVIDLGRLGADDVTVQIVMIGAPFERNDTVTLTWLGTPATGEPVIYTKVVAVTSVPAVLEISVPNADIRAINGGNGRATYVLTKANGDPPQSSKRATARVTGQIPLPAPAVLEAVGNTLDPTLDRAHVQIPVYDKMANGDLIDMIWLGTQQNGAPHLYEGQHIVSASEVGNVIYIPVPEHDIAILANGTLDVSYRVSNDTLRPLDVRVSDHLNLTIAQRRAELPAPSVDEAPDGVLDPEQVPIHATLRVPYTGTAVGDLLTWYWQAESPDGTDQDSIPITYPIAGQPVTFFIPRALIEPSLNTIVKVFYSLELASTGQFQYSQVLDLTIGKLIGELPAPQVLEATGTALDPMQALNGATVRVRYASMDLQDVITLTWLGSPGAGSPADQQVTGSATGQVDFPIPASVIGANIGQRVSVVYKVKRSTTEKQSEFLLLDVTPIPDSQLPTPLIAQANAQTKVLNLATFVGNATTTVAKWPFIATGQRVWLRLEGVTESGGPHAIVLLDGAELTGAQIGSGLSESVLRTALEKLGQDTTLTVVCKVAFNGVADEYSALPLPMSVYEFKLHHDWVTPIIVSVKDSKGEVTEGGTTFDINLTLSGTGTLDTELEMLDGPTRLTTAHTDLNGAWTVDLTNQRPKGYRITARALDGSGLVSQQRTYEVLANITPTIEQVRDSRGALGNGGTTVDTTVAASGKAAPNEQVQVLDGTAPKGNASVNGNGDWSLPVTGLAVGTHSLKAQALYANRPESTVWNVVVASAIAPTISSIRDSDGDEIAPNGFTVDTRLTLTGNANANLEVEIFDGTASKGRVTVNGSGVWTSTLENLSVASHSMTAKALYGNGATSSVRNFTIVALVNPSITSVVDPQNAPIANGGSTFASSATASGQASIHQMVEVFDGTVSKGTATANASGAWSHVVSGLAVGARALTAKALYANNPVSAPWSFTVKAATVPTLLSVRDSRGEVANGGSTTDTTVTASGKAAPNEQVQVLDGTAPKGNASVNGNGDWSLPVAGLAIGAHSLKAVAQYGSGPESNIRTFAVRSPVPDFVLDPTPVNLSGRIYLLPDYANLDPVSWPAGTTYTRVPSSGVAPYTYTSSNPAVIRVDANGTIYSRGNGSATITVTDSQGRSGSYPVNVSNVIHVIGLGNSLYRDAVSAAASRSKRIPSLAELNEIYAAYLGRWPMGNRLYWSTTPGSGLSTVRCKNLVTGGWQDLSTRVFQVGGDYANVVAI